MPTNLSFKKVSPALALSAAGDFPAAFSDFRFPFPEELPFLPAKEAPGDVGAGLSPFSTPLLASAPKRGSRMREGGEAGVPGGDGSAGGGVGGKGGGVWVGSEEGPAAAATVVLAAVATTVGPGMAAYGVE